MKQTNLQKAQARLREKFIKNGVKMLAPETVYFSKDTKIGKNVTIEPFVVLGEKVKICLLYKIKSFSHLENVKIENNVTVGPFARLRPGTVLKSGSRVGNFVEIKKSKIGKNSKIWHFSHIQSNAKIGEIYVDYELGKDEDFYKDEEGEWQLREDFSDETEVEPDEGSETDEGGETEFLYANQRVNAVQGRVIVFPAGYVHTHRGNPPIGQTKYIATTWGVMQG